MCLVAVFALQTAGVHAKNSQDYRQEADQYYLEQNFKKAYQGYYKLARMGDHYAQGQLSNMYANGEGKKVDLEEAYAWAALAAEGGEVEMLKSSEVLLLKTSDQAKAQKKAAKLKKKYGKEALAKKAEAASRKDLKNFGRCTGSRIGCS